MPDRTGQQLGNYRLLKLIGLDNPIETYMGVSVQANALATLRVLTSPQEKIYVQQFLAEAATLSHLNHPNIVRVLAYGEVASTLYLATDAPTQRTLGDIYLRGQRVELPSVVRSVKQIADALQYAHDRGVLHLDLRPENLLAGAQQTILLTNFYLPGLQRIGPSIPIMAPELVQGRGQPASDQFALGAIAYEWLSGTPPQPNGQTIQPLRTFAPHIAPDVERAILRALEQDWRARFETVKDFAEALEQATISTFVSRASVPASLSAPPPPAESSGTPGAAAPTGPYADLPGPAIQYPIYPPEPALRPVYTYPAVQVVPLAYVEPPKPPIYYPLTRKAPIHLQIFGMLLYSTLLAISIMGSVLYLIHSYHPGLSTGIYTNLDGSVNVLAIILTVAIVLVIIPACSVLSGAFFGSWRGLLVSLLSAFGGLYLIRYSNPQTVDVVTASYLLLPPLALSALLVGLIYDRRKYASWGKSMLTIMLGTAINMVWFYVLVLLAENNSNVFSGISSSSGFTSTNIAVVADIVLGCIGIFLLLLYSLLVSAIEGTIHHAIASSKKKK